MADTKAFDARLQMARNGKPAPWPASRPSIWLAVCVFTVLLALLLLSHANNAGVHQQIMQVVSLLVFGLALLSQRPQPLRASEAEPHVTLGWLLFALALALFTYAPVFSLGFVSDDFTYVVLAPQPVSQMLWAQFTHGTFAAFFRPLGFASFALDYRLWNQWAPGWHVSSLCLHLIATATVFYLCRELRWSGESCGTTAAIFAVLPVSTEAVVWIAARFDLIAAVFMLWALILYLRARSQGSLLPYVGSLTCLALALMSKEIAYITPFALIAVEALLAERRRWMAVLPFFALAMAALAWRTHILGSLGGYARLGETPGSHELTLRSLQAVFVRAPSVLLFAINWNQPRVVFGCLLAAATAALLIPVAFLPRRERVGVLAFAVTWCLFAALPAQSLLMIPPSLVNTRELYVSAAGAALLLGLLLARSSSRMWRRSWTVALLLCLIATTRHNLAAWTNGSNVGQEFLHELRQSQPEPAASTEFVVHDLPRWTEGGVYLLLNRALSDSIGLAYGRQDLTARRADEAPHPDVQHRIDVYWISDYRGKRRPLIRVGDASR